ncbi:MAG: heavy-metal-associated domain-containing protein [Xenococcus sp. (in: cyanobacteria)]
MIIEFNVPDMACDACVKTITQAVLALDAQALVKANSQTKQVTIDSSASESSVKKAIADAGYSPV